MAPPRAGSLDFFPVVHLLTGPPGLVRNGGIWKALKAGLSSASDPPRVMVQPLHFASYTLSDAAWTEWKEEIEGRTRITRELAELLGPRRDVFLDSGGFQLLHRDKIDLSRWGVDLCREDVLELQRKFGPQRIASLDVPLHPALATPDASKAIWKSVRNARWLAETSSSWAGDPRPYLVVHGRRPTELRTYFRRLESEVPQSWLRRGEFGIALGSQVPLTKSPGQILGNVRETLAWMDRTVGEGVPLHLFGVGDGIAGAAAAASRGRAISYDNSTYVQKAFRFRIFDSQLGRYREYVPHFAPRCNCVGCAALQAHGADFVADLMARPAYQPAQTSAGRVNRSDILGLIALHNLFHWRQRAVSVDGGLAIAGKMAIAMPVLASARYSGYEFPLKEFRPRTENLVVLPCSKGRPYSESRSHRRVLAHLSEDGFEEGRDFDRITLSGLYGPVHWAHESHPSIVSYDFELGPLVNRRHLGLLRVRTATVLSVLRRKYTTIVAYLHSKPYSEAFGEVARSFEVWIADEPHDICLRLDEAS